MPPRNKKNRKGVRKERVAFRGNRSAPARQKHWTRLVRDEGIEELDTETSESVVAKGALSRKRTVIVPDDQTGDDHVRKLREGTVVAMRGRVADVDVGDGVWPCTVRRVLRTRQIKERHPVVVGDRVRFSVVHHGEAIADEGVIESVRSRSSELSRRSGRRIHVIAANVDQVLIVSSVATPEPKPHLIDRYIVAALAGRMEPAICLNKIDLIPTADAGDLLQRYRTLGYLTLRTSAVTGQGIDELGKLLANKSSVVAGQSGVGKSSLVNAIEPGLNLRVGEIIDHTQKGRHTTSTARLWPLRSGGYVVDTPGIKSFDVSIVSKPELEMYFEEFVERVADCKFGDCTHIDETDCAIKAAVDAGDIHPDRYASYVRLYEEPAT
ncbi:MAG: ribosome small subunit-dependent GTPase A [Planctomycetes bacterium]|nr:ribosome small subunit-dependent GTPase A [Planctomycetota bacterium]